MRKTPLLAAIVLSVAIGAPRFAAALRAVFFTARFFDGFFVFFADFFFFFPAISLSLVRIARIE